MAAVAELGSLGGVRASPCQPKPKTKTKERDNMRGPNEDKEQADRDNRADQLNPNNPAYESSRSGNQQDDDYPEMEKLCDSDD